MINLVIVSLSPWGRWEGEPRANSRQDTAGSCAAAQARRRATSIGPFSALSTKEFRIVWGIVHNSTRSVRSCDPSSPFLWLIVLRLLNPLLLSAAAAAAVYTTLSQVMLAGS